MNLGESARFEKDVGTTRCGKGVEPEAVMSGRPNESGGDEADERRLAQRWRVRFRCHFQVAGEVYEGHIIDISLGGAFIESEDTPTADSGIRIQIQLGGRSLVINGIVRHSGWFLMEMRNVNGFGVEFENLSFAANAFVRKVLSHVSHPAASKTSLER